MPKVVVISRRESLLGSAMEFLTADEKEWMVLMTSESQPLADLVQKMTEVNPSIVILPRQDHGYDEQLSMQMMLNCENLNKVILVSLSENLMEVYCKKRIQVKSVKDIFSEIDARLSDI